MIKDLHPSIIKKDQYILLCANDDGKEVHHLPMKLDEEGCCYGEYCYDRQDVDKWIRERLGMQYKKIAICKMVDLVLIDQQSMYKE